MHKQSVQVIRVPLPSAKAAGLIVIALLIALFPTLAIAQQNNSPAAPQQSSASSVPQIIQFSGLLASAPSGTVSITFTLYENEQGGTALWSETQNVQVDAQGHYTALLGSTSPDGLPLSLFITVQAHWLAVQPAGPEYTEQPRVLLVSAPYALKAGDAETIGGLPPSAFVRVDASSGASGTIAGTSAGTTTVATTASKGSAHTKPVRLTTTECGDFCNAGTGYQIGGANVVATPGGVNSGNIALGGGLFSITTGTGNTASGNRALLSNTTGSGNTASGASALLGNTTGFSNTANGVSALASNTAGSDNTASGTGALLSNTTGIDNTASGLDALAFTPRGTTTRPAVMGHSCKTPRGATTWPAVTKRSLATPLGAPTRPAVTKRSSAIPMGTATRPAATTRSSATRPGSSTRQPAIKRSTTVTGATTQPAVSTRWQATPPGTTTRQRFRSARIQHHRV